MIDRGAAVGGTEFTLYADNGKVIATCILDALEPEGLFVAHLLAYLSERADASSPRAPQRPSSVSSATEAGVLRFPVRVAG